MASFLALYWWMAVSASLQKSGTFDESVHLTAGTSYLLYHDYRLNPENGLLPQAWAALPLMFSRPAYPALDSHPWRTSDVWVLARDFLFRSGNAPDSLLLQGRSMVALFGAATCWLVYLWSKSLFGTTGAAISLVLCVFSPTMLAHGAVVTSDMAMALTMSAALWTYARLLSAPSVSRCVVCGLVFGVLAVAKYSSIMIAPVLLLLLLVHVAANACAAGSTFRDTIDAAPAGGARLHMAIFTLGSGAIAWLVVWAFYGFRYSIANPDLPPVSSLTPPWEVILGSDRLLIRTIGWAKTMHLLPEAFVYGLGHVLRLAERRVTFFLGEQGFGGWRAFFPVAFAIKTTLPFLMILLFAAYDRSRTILSEKRRGAGFSAQDWLPFAPLALFLGVFWAFALTSHLNIGHRHLLPIYPLLFILAGASARIIEQGRALGRALIVLLMLWHAAASMAIRPHYLSYFNELIGGPDNGYKYFVDSSLDWGQDLPALKAWLDKNELSNQDNTPVHLAYFGTSSPEYYGIKSRFLYRFLDGREAINPDPMTGGVYCLSATLYQGLCLGKWFMKQWDAGAEREFVKMREAARQLMAGAVTDPALREFMGTAGPRARDSLLKQWEAIRFFKLITYLHRRPPDEIIAHSMLVFRLTDEEARGINENPLPGP